MQRLFSSFADGWPGAGLLVLRLVTGGGLLYGGIASGWPASFAEMLPSVIRVGTGVLIGVGLYTPVAGILAAIVEAWIAFSHPYNPSTSIGLIGLGVALAMIGPGAWSIDARLFGRKEIRPSDFERESNPA